MNKKELRHYVRTLKDEHTPDEKRQMAETVCTRILMHPRVKEANVILAYWSLPDEVDSHELVNELWKQGKRILLPKVISNTEMTIHEFQGMESMAMGAFGIMEPTTPSIELYNETTTNPEEPATLLALIPGMAFSKDGHRLGRGKGYYDRFLSRTRIYKIGVCYPFQLLDTIPYDDYDIKMDEIVNGIF